MTDTDREYGLAGLHAENLQSGAMLAPHDRVKESELGPDDQRLIDEGLLVLIEPPDEPTVRDLRARAADLGIEGRSKMTTEELQAAIAGAEAPIVAAAKDGIAESDAMKGGEG